MLANARSGLTDGPSLGVGQIESVPRIRGRRRAGLVVWESSRLPADKRRSLQAATELWTPTRWGKQLLVDNGFDASAVHVVPEGVDVNLFTPRRDGAIRPFRFLNVGRCTVRKGVGDLVRAFCREFASDERVELVLHCGAGTADWLGRQLARDGIRKHAPILVSAPCGEAALVDTYNRADALVLASKSEGWGLPAVEAMACGLPVIATSYSALAELVHDDVGYPIRVERMIDVDDPRHFPPPGPYGQWAQPDFDHLCALLRHVFEHPEEAREKGRRARDEAVARWTWDHAAAIACTILGIA
jgi:glycosyltransferase involved in cell wall biosynthesis